MHCRIECDALSTPICGTGSNFNYQKRLLDVRSPTSTYLGSHDALVQRIRYSRAKAQERLMRVQHAGSSIMDLPRQQPSYAGSTHNGDPEPAADA